MNNNTSSICWQSDTYWLIGDYIDFAQYKIILPVYGTVCLLGHIFCASSFLHQAKTEKAYVYQIYLSIAEIVDVFAFIIFSLTFLGGGAERPGYDWYLKIYTLMWYCAHLAIPFYNTMNMLCLFLSVSMAADRAFALIKPFVYKDINRRKHQKIALISCVVLAVGISSLNFRLFEVQEDDEIKYKIGPDKNYVGTVTSKVLSHSCNVARMIGLVALVGCNVFILRAVRKLAKQKSKITSKGGASVSSNDKETKEKERERSLILLTVSQSFFRSVLMFGYVIFYTAVYVVPNFNTCDHLLWAPVQHSIIMLCDLGSTVTVLVLNRKSNATKKFLKLFKCRNRVDQESSVGMTLQNTKKVH